MKNYELLCVLPGTLSEDEVTPVMKQVLDIVSAQGGTDVTVQDRGKLRLAHPIKHIRYGYFHLIQFQSEPETIEKMNAKLRFIKELLRALITKYNPELRAHKNIRLPEVEAIQKAAKKGTPVKEERKAKEVKSESDKDTGKPSEKKMEKIEEKLDKVLDSALKEV